MSQSSEPQAQNNPKVEEDKSTGADNRRRLVNFLLEPYVQMKLGIFANALALSFAFLVGAIVYVRTKDLFQIVIQLTEMEEEVLSMAKQYAMDITLWLGLLTFFYMIINILMSVYFTHKMIGPGVALRKHIRSLREGKYSARTYLRRGDSMKEVAAELNLFSELLEKNHTAAIKDDKPS